MFDLGEFLRNEGLEKYQDVARVEDMRTLMGDGARRLADDNIVVSVGNKPNLRLQVHGGENIGGHKLFLGPDMVGNIHIFLGGRNSRMIFEGSARPVNCDIRLWRQSYLRIGAGTTINGARIIADRSRVLIGRDCLFSDELLLQSNDQHLIYDLRARAPLNKQDRYIEIGDHVWVGRRTTIMPDVRVGEGSVLGAASVVTKDVPAFCAAAGAPARVVREEVSWGRKPSALTSDEKDWFDATFYREDML